MYNSTGLSFIATMKIHGRSVIVESERLLTRSLPSVPTKLHFQFFSGHYMISVVDGEYAGKDIDSPDSGYLQVSDSSNVFDLMSAESRVVTLNDFSEDVQYIYLRTIDWYRVQQEFAGEDAFDDQDVEYNFILAVPRLDKKGNGTYLAMEEGAWRYRRLDAPDTTIYAPIELTIEKRGVAR
ncbi:MULTISPECIES: hypothetical protein [Pseudomonas]|uniref:Uncharacterized protein n=1 Tax=Pseudomonas fluorescens TaxID=294 RepID=A0A0F4U0W5_PSEFL|nr:MULTISPECIES: hypothetical protein [Pseudomonas]KJZ49969.1 hypothetical protein VC35_02455 [Pseudomonas fluorescens]